MIFLRIFDCEILAEKLEKALAGNLKRCKRSQTACSSEVCTKILARKIGAPGKLAGWKGAPGSEEPKKQARLAASNYGLG